MAWVLLGVFLVGGAIVGAFALGWCIGHETSSEIERCIRDEEFGAAGAYDPLPHEWSRDIGQST